MTEQQQPLDLQQLSDEGLDDWHLMLGRLKARFTTSDLTTGAELAQRIAEAAAGVTPPPVVTLTWGATLVTLGGRGVTPVVVSLARDISRAAADLGLRSQATGVHQLDLGLDTAHGEDLAPFYAALLGVEVRDGEPVDPDGLLPTVWWQEPGPDDPAHALPPQGFEQRWHFDVWVAPEQGEQRLAAALAAGGRLVSDAAAPAYWVVEDADGNRSCICTEASR